MTLKGQRQLKDRYDELKNFDISFKHFKDMLVAILRIY
jgi:hypothetical protein